MGGIRSLVQAEVAYYAHNLCGVTQAAEFYITNSWVNIYGRGDQAGATGAKQAGAGRSVG